MAWQAHIDKLMALKCFEHVAICGRNGGVWAASAGFSVQEDEIKNFEKRLGGGQCSDDVKFGKVKAGGKQFLFQRIFDGQSMMGKDKTSGCIVAIAKQCFIVGTYADGQQVEKANNEVLKYVEYMKGQGY